GTPDAQPAGQPRTPVARGRPSRRPATTIPASVYVSRGAHHGTDSDQAGRPPRALRHQLLAVDPGRTGDRLGQRLSERAGQGRKRTATHWRRTWSRLTE